MGSKEVGRGLHGRDGGAAAGGHRRHDPRLAHTRPGWRPAPQEVIVAQEICRPWACAGSRPWWWPARLRPDHLDLLPGARAEDQCAPAPARMPEWRKCSLPGVEQMTVAVMGCVVNGPGESKHANIGVGLPAPRRSSRCTSTSRHSKGERIAEEFHLRRGVRRTATIAAYERTARPQVPSHAPETPAYHPEQAAACSPGWRRGGASPRTAARSAAPSASRISTRPWPSSTRSLDRECRGSPPQPRGGVQLLPDALDAHRARAVGERLHLRCEGGRLADIAGRVGRGELPMTAEESRSEAALRPSRPAARSRQPRRSLAARRLAGPARRAAPSLTYGAVVVLLSLAVAGSWGKVGGSGNCCNDVASS